MAEMNPFLSGRFWKYFFLTFVTVLLIIAIQIVWRYYEDFLFKDIPVSFTLQALFWLTLGALLLPVRVAMFFAPCIWFAKKAGINVLRSLLYGMPFVMAIAALCFVFDNTLRIKSFKDASIMVYEARQTGPPEYPFTRLSDEERGCFDGSTPASTTCGNLIATVDSLGADSKMRP